MSGKRGRPDPSVHTLAPITILANYDRPKSGSGKTELDDIVHANAVIIVLVPGTGVALHLTAAWKVISLSGDYASEAALRAMENVLGIPVRPTRVLLEVFPKVCQALPNRVAQTNGIAFEVRWQRKTKRESEEKRKTRNEDNKNFYYRFKSQQHGEFSSVMTNGSTTPLVRDKCGDEESGYEPFEHRKLAHPTSDLDTLIHLLKGSLGSGILAMPLAFLNAGLIFGVIATIAVGVICTYCVHVLVECAHVLYKRTRVPSLDYSEVAEAAFTVGPQGVKKYRRLAKATIDTFLTVDLYGCCCVYIVFVAKNIKQVADYNTGSDIDVRLYMAMLLLPLILMNLIRNLKWLAPFSMIANILMAIGIGITFYYIFTDIPSISDKKYFSSFQQLPLFFGTAIFALEGIGVVMPLENNMKTPQHFIGCPGVLNSGMSVVVLLYTAVGFFGYLKYGEATEGSITLNLPTHDLLAQSVKIMIAIAILLTYSLQFYVPMGIIWRNIKQWFSSHETSGELGVRIALITLSVGIAAAVPNLGPFISLVGAVCLSMLGLIFPAIIETVTFWEKPGMGRYNWRLWKNIFLILFGILGFVTGTITSLQEIYDSFNK